MSTEELLSRLEELSAELRVRDRPERRAWSRLEPTKKGWTARPYDDQAFELWNEVLRRFPDDLHSVHHLAIMHHARAIDVEQSERPSRSDDDWAQALKHWHRLYEAAEFWTELSARVHAEPGQVEGVRRDLAERLLRMHFDIALDEHSPHHRARFHVRLALDSPFPQELVESVRLGAYESAVARLDAVVWRPETIDEPVLLPAIEAVIHYLDRDDGCVKALNDLLTLLNRLESGQIQQVNGISDPDERRRAIDGLRATVKRYDGYISRLESLLLAAPEPDELALAARCDLALWHSRVGQACRVAQAYDDAAGYYERALRAARAGADPRAGDLLMEKLFCTALAARERASGSDSAEARRLLAATETSERLPGAIRLVRAQTWLRLGDLDEADREAALAQAAIDSPTGHADARWAAPATLRKECERLREEIREERLMVTAYGGREALRLQQQGIKAFNDGRNDEAIALLREARAAAGDGTSKDGTSKIDADLAYCLNAAAVELVESAADNGGAGGLSTALPAALGRAQKMLREAQSLDPNRVDVTQNMIKFMILDLRLKANR